MNFARPGRDAARSPCEAVLRRTGTLPEAGARYGPGSAAHRSAKSYALRCVRGTSPLLRVTVDDRAEQLPVLAGKPHHLDLFDRIEIGRRGLDADARNIGVDLEIHVGNNLHDVLTCKIVAAAFQH